MAQVTVQQLAEVVGATADRLLTQMKEAGFDEAWIDPLGNAIGRIGNGKKILDEY